jgi:hypothetical protein
MTKKYFINQFEELDDAATQEKLTRRKRFGKAASSRFRNKRPQLHQNEGRRRHLARR